MIETEIDLARRLFLLRLAAKLEVPVDDVDDVVQESLLRFYSHDYQSRNLAEPMERALLARIGYSTYLDLLRKRRAARTHLDHYRLEFVRREHGVREAAVRDVQDLVRRTLVSADEIALLESRYGDGKTIEEMARERRRHPNSIRRRLDRVIARLAACAEDIQELQRSIV